MAKEKIEYRALKGVELRKATEEEPAKIVGYAAVFDKLSEDLGGFRELIKPGAFKRTLDDGADVRALVDHDSSRIIGRNKAGTLRVSEDDKGLAIEIDVPDTQVGRDIVTSLERGDVDGMSFGFRTMTDDWRTIDGEYVRELQDVDLFDVSVVTYPAYPDTQVAVRSLDGFKQESVQCDITLRRRRLDLADKVFPSE